MNGKKAFVALETLGFAKETKGELKRVVIEDNKALNRMYNEVGRAVNSLHSILSKDNLYTTSMADVRRQVIAVVRLVNRELDVFIDSDKKQSKVKGKFKVLSLKGIPVKKEAK